MDITEKQLREQIRDLCKLFGWKFHFTWTSIHSPRGMPDLILCRENEDGTASLLFAELKSEKRNPTEAQREWLNILGKVPSVGVYLWYPHDIDRIALILQGFPDII